MNDIVKVLYSITGIHENECYDAADEIERLRKYEQMVWFIANDYHELSYDKIKWQRDEWKKRCQKLMAEDTDDAPLGHTEHELKDLDF